MFATDLTAGEVTGIFLPIIEAYAGRPAPPEGQAGYVPPTEIWDGPIAPGDQPGGVAAPAADRSEQKRYALGAGCMLILVVFICASTIFLLDALSPDALYCGPFKFIFDLIGLDLICP